MKPQFEIKDIVFLKTDPDLLPRIILSYQVTEKNITYNLCCGIESSWHYGFEIITDKTTVIKKIEPGFGK